MQDVLRTFLHRSHGWFGTPCRLQSLQWLCDWLKNTPQTKH